MPSTGAVMLFVTVTWIQSPQFASIAGAGNWPLIMITSRRTPSVEIRPRLIVKSYERVTPVDGTSPSMEASEFSVVASPHGAWSPPPNHFGNVGWHRVPQVPPPTCCSTVRGLVGSAHFVEVLDELDELDEPVPVGPVGLIEEELPRLNGADEMTLDDGEPEIGPVTLPDFEIEPEIGPVTLPDLEMELELVVRGLALPLPHPTTEVTVELMTLLTV